MSGRNTLGLMASLLLLAGCGATDQYRQEYDDLGKKTAAEFAQVAGVASSDYRYTHGIDQGQNLNVQATLTADADPAELPGKLKEIAQKNYWLDVPAPAGLAMSVIVFAAKPPHERISLEQVDVSDTAEMERKYGPGPKKK